MNDHQPDHHHDDNEQADTGRRLPKDTATDDHEPDFSRLRLARASLDNAFPQE